MHKTVFWRSMMLQGCWSFEGMQNLGFLFCLDPWLRRSYPEREDYRDAARRHVEFFNTQPYMAGYVVGVAGALEERRARSDAAGRPALEDRISQLKKAMGSALAAAGDSFFWGALKPATAVWTVLAWLALWTLDVPHPLLLGALFGIAAYNAPALWVRWDGPRKGEEMQEGVAQEMKRLNWQERTRWIRLAGLAGVLLLTLSALVVPPFEAPPSRLLGAAVLLAALALRRSGFSTFKIYAAGVLLFVAAAFTGVV